MSKKPLVLIFLLIVSCRSEVKKPLTKEGLEPSEIIAVQLLSKEDQDLYFKQKPLRAVRAYFFASQCSISECDSRLVSVQRTCLKSRKNMGWRMIMAGALDVLIFHVSDGGNAHIIMRGHHLEDTDLSSGRYFIFETDYDDPSSDVKQHIQSDTKPADEPSAKDQHSSQPPKDAPH